MTFDEFKLNVSAYIKEAGLCEEPSFSHDDEKGVHKGYISGILFLANGISKKITVKFKGRTFMFTPKKIEVL